MGIRKVIFIGYQPLTAKIEKDYYIPELQGAGFDLEYWDVTRAYFEDLDATNRLEVPYVKHFGSLRAMKPAIRKNREDSIFIINITFAGRSCNLMSLLTGEQATTGFFARGMLPFPALHDPLFSKLWRRLKAALRVNVVRRYLWNTWALTMKRAGRIKPYDLLFTAGSEGFHTVGLGSEIDLRKSRIVEINTSDYEQARKALQSGRPVECPYYVFLDEYLPFHPDFKLFSLETVDPEKYFSEINRFFDHLEERNDIPVVIAAHPKSNYDVNPFNGREIIKFKTDALVRHSEMVIAHSSTAISYAVIFERPLMLIYESEMRRIYKDGHIALIESFGESLKCPVYDVSSGNGISFEQARLDQNAYNNFKYKYLASKSSENGNSAEIVIDELRKFGK